MKKQYSLFLVMLLGLLGFQAAAFPVTVNVQGDGPVLWGDTQASMTNVIPVGDNQVIDFSGTIFFTTPTGYTMVTRTIDCADYTSGPQDLDPVSGNNRIFNRNFYKDRNYTLLFVTRSETSTDDISFLLENGTASLYRESETEGAAAELVQELTAGKMAIAPLLTSSNYFIVAGEGLTMTVTDKDGKVKSTNEDTQEFHRYVCKVAGWEANSYTIATKDVPATKEAYDVTFNIIGANTVELRHYTAQPFTETKETISKGQTVNFPANDTWSVYPSNIDDEFIKVTDADGNEVEIFQNTQYNGPTYFMINTYSPVSSVYNIYLTEEEPMHLYLVGEASGNVMKPEFEFTEDANSWTLSAAELSGKFRIKSDDNTIDLGSNGQPVELNVAYTPAQGASAADMELAAGSISNAKITVAKDGYTITVTGTAGIATISRDALDTTATYFDLQGRRISNENVAGGIFIQVANGQARKIAVK